MIGKDILGIHLGAEAVQYVSVAKGMRGFSPRRPASGMGAEGRLVGSGTSALKDLLERIPPARGRRIHLVLPRDHFFVREMELPAMPPEEALAAVESALPLHAHLPPDRIYYDILFSRFRKGRVHALVIYAERGRIDPLRQLFADTGHLAGLKGIFPAFVGMGAWMAARGHDLPAGIVFAGEGRQELSLHGPKGPILSMTFPEGEAAHAMALARVARDYPEAEGRIHVLSGEGEGLPEARKDPLARLPGPQENLAVAAVAPALLGAQVPAVDPSPAAVKVMKPLRILIPLALLGALACYGLTERMERRITDEKVAMTALTAEVRGLRKKLEPLEAHRKALKTADKFRKDVGDFMGERPALYDDINGIAKLVPEGTWFSSLNFKGGVLTLKGRSGDALKVLDVLRSSGLFRQVRLRGTVSRRPSGEERFSLSITLKDKGRGEVNP